MRFERITLNNYGVYFGTHTFKFNMPSGKNVCLVDGNNGWGKTTIQKAIKYCLYGVQKSTTERFEQINQRARKQDRFNMMTQIEFEHQKKKYQVTRSVEADKSGRAEENFMVLVNGIMSKAPESVIADILPRDASQFFFFDGEDIKRYTDLENPEETRNAIELVLGIPAIRNAVKHAEDLHKILDRKITLELRKDKDAEQLANEIEKMEKDIQQYQNSIIDLKKNKTKLRDGLDLIERQMSTHEAAKESILKMDSNRKEILVIHNELSGIEENYYSDVSKLPFLIIKRELEDIRARKSAEFDRVRGQIGERGRIEGMINALQSLKMGEKCYCGTPLSNAEILYIQKYLENLKSQQGNHSDAVDYDTSAIRRIERALGKIDTYKIDLEGWEEKRTLISQIDDLEAENKNLERKLGTISAEEIRSLSSKRDKFVQELSSVDRDIEWNDGALSQLKILRERKGRERDKMIPDSPQKSLLNRELELTRGIETALDDLLEETIEDKRKRIESETTKVHKQLTNKPSVYSGIRLKDDYTFSIFDIENGQVKNEQISQGEKEILALSFIAGLNRSTDKEAPVIMDTPFARLDAEHKGNVVKFLHNLSSQVVILATDEDINESNYGLIEPYIGKRYEIIFDMAQKSSSIREVR